MRNNRRRAVPMFDASGKLIENVPIDEARLMMHSGYAEATMATRDGRAYIVSIRELASPSRNVLDPLISKPNN